MRLREALQDKADTLRGSLFFFLAYMPNGIYYPFISIYYKEIGLNMSQIGIISAVSLFVPMAVQTLWGRLADRTGRRRILMLTLLLSGLSLPLLHFGQGYVYALLITLLFVAMNTSTQPLTETIALDYCQARRLRFAPMRVWGSIGFGVVPIAIGGLLDQDIDNMLWLYPVVSAVAVASCLLMPKGQAGLAQGARAKGEKGTLRRLLKDPLVDFVLMVNFAVALCMGMGNFLPVYAVEMGVSTDLAGKLNTVSAACEVPFYLFVDFFLRKRSKEQVMLFTLLTTVLRMLIAYVAGFFPAQGFLLLCASQMLHSVSYVCMSFCSVQLIHAHVPEQHKATAQTLVAMIALGLARAAGSLIFGQMGDSLGLQSAYLALSGIIAAGAIPSLLLYRRMRRAAQGALAQEAQAG